MDSPARDNKAHEIDEGSWAYLSVQQAQRNDALLDGVIDACEESGWPAVTWSPAQHKEGPTARFFEGMGHAVEHADMVIVLVNGSSTITDAELAFAYRHRRPVVALEISDGEPCSSDVRAMLRGYDRVLTVECRDAAECVVGLRDALSSAVFAAMVDPPAGVTENA